MSGRLFRFQVGLGEMHAKTVDQEERTRSQDKSDRRRNLFLKRPLFVIRVWMLVIAIECIAMFRLQASRPAREQGNSFIIDSKAGGTVQRNNRKQICANHGVIVQSRNVRRAMSGSSGFQDAIALPACSLMKAIASFGLVER